MQVDRSDVTRRAVGWQGRSGSRPAVPEYVIRMANFSELSIAGRVATPDESEWDETRAAWNRVADQNPSAVAFMQSAQDVAAVVEFARKHQLKVAPQGTGHGAVALGPLDDTVLIKTERMRDIDIDRETGVARVESGVLALELGGA